MTPETSLGFEAIKFSRDVLEIDLLPWQQWLFIHGLELTPFGGYRFRTVLVLVSRQCGKTTGAAALSLWRIVMDGAEGVLGTSTNLDYAKEAWRKAVRLAWGPEGSKYFQGVPQLRGVFAKPREANGQESLSTVDGARYKIGTASETGGRSLSIDLALLDELRQHKTFAAWAAASKTTNARPRGQRWALSNMGDDTSVVLNHFQQLGRSRIAWLAKNDLSWSGDLARAVVLLAPELAELPDREIAEGDPSLALFEYSAPQGCAVDDRAAWQWSVPALGYTISEETVASDAANDPEEVFRTEVLCQRVPTLVPLPLTLDMWRSRLDADSAIKPDDPVVFSVEVALDHKSASIGVAGVRADGATHVGLIAQDFGTDWVLPRLLELVDANKTYKIERGGKTCDAVVVDPSSPAVALVDPLRAAKVEPVLMTSRDVATAWGDLQDACTDGTVWHRDQPLVDVALAGAVKRDLGDGGWALGRRKSAAVSVDATPATCVANARWGLSVVSRKRGPAIY